MIEDLIEAHIEAAMAEAYPGLPETDYLILFTGGVPDYSAKGRSVVGSEILTVRVVVESTERFDRAPFWREFGLREVNLEGTVVRQEYKGHKFSNFTEQSGHKVTTFTLEYTAPVFEE